MPASMCFIATRYLSVVEGARRAFLRRQPFLDDHRDHHGLGRLRGVPVLGSFGDKGGESSAPLLFRTVNVLEAYLLLPLLS